MLCKKKVQETRGQRRRNETIVRRVGRPRVDIPLDQLRAVASTFLTYEEIARIFGCSAATIARNYADEVKRGRALGTISLRARMRERSRRSDRILIHLYDRYVHDDV